MLPGWQIKQYSCQFLSKTNKLYQLIKWSWDCLYQIIKQSLNFFLYKLFNFFYYFKPQFHWEYNTIYKYCIQWFHGYSLGNSFEIRLNMESNDIQTLQYLRRTFNNLNSKSKWNQIINGIWRHNKIKINPQNKQLFSLFSFFRKSKCMSRSNNDESIKYKLDSKTKKRSCF